MVRITPSPKEPLLHFERVAKTGTGAIKIVQGVSTIE